MLERTAGQVDDMPLRHEVEIDDLCKELSRWSRSLPRSAQVRVLHVFSDSMLRAEPRCEFARRSRVPGIDTSAESESPVVMSPGEWGFR